MRTYTRTCECNNCAKCNRRAYINSQRAARRLVVPPKPVGRPRIQPDFVRLAAYKEEWLTMTHGDEIVLHDIARICHYPLDEVMRLARECGLLVGLSKGGQSANAVLPLKERIARMQEKGFTEFK